MADPITLLTIAAVGSAATAGYTAYEGARAQDRAEDAADEAAAVADASETAAQIKKKQSSAVAGTVGGGGVQPFTVNPNDTNIFS